MKLRYLIAATMIASSLSACGSDSTGSVIDNTNGNPESEDTDSGITNAGTTLEHTPSDDDTLNLIGLVKIEPNSVEADFSRALFGRLDRGLTVAAMKNFYYPDADNCAFVLYDSPPPNSGPEFVVLDQRPAKLSAGETIIISSDAGTYATLEREYDETGPRYQTNVRLTGAPPGNLSVDIPGEEFPAFSGLAIPDVPELRVSVPTDNQPITADTEFSWVANNVSESVFELYMGGFTGNGDEVIEVACAIVDDGSFTFPPEVRAAIGDNFSENWNAFLRVVYDTAQTENAIVFIANSVERL